MKAIVYYNYGSPDVLKLEEIEKPAAGDDQVLLKVRAASVNPYDWHFMRGMPYVVRIPAGPRKPKVNRLGLDVAGQVEAVGKNVTQFKPGDKVFGSCSGAFAEYACASESAVVLMPDNVTFEQAAAVPVAAFTALQALRDNGRIQPGDTVLINGASGGVGLSEVLVTGGQERIGPKDADQSWAAIRRAISPSPVRNAAARDCCLSSKCFPRP